MLVLLEVKGRWRPQNTPTLETVSLRSTISKNSACRSSNNLPASHKVNLDGLAKCLFKPIRELVVLLASGFVHLVCKANLLYPSQD
jgi:hypothetical protein